MERNRNVIDGHADGFKRKEMEKKIKSYIFTYKRLKWLISVQE